MTPTGPPAAADAERGGQAVDVRLAGRLGAALDAALSQLARDTPYSVDLVTQDVRWQAGQERLFQDYRGDLSGRYLDAVEVAHRRQPDLGLDLDLDKAVKVLEHVMASQNADGSFGPPAPAVQMDHGAAWGNGMLLQGLLAARSWAPEAHHADLHETTLALADRLAFSAPAWARPMAGGGGHKFLLDPLSAVLPLVRLGRSLGGGAGNRYLDAADLLVRALPRELDGLHSHGSLLAIRGGLALCEVRPDDELERALLARARHIGHTTVLPHGGVLETVGRGRQINTEACGIADWTMLQVSLYRRTGDPDHLERAVRTAVNSLLHTQRESGHFGCQTIAGDRGLLVSDYAPEAWWCCTFHAIRALDELARAAVTLEGAQLSVHLPVDVRSRAGGLDLVDVTGDHPRSDAVSLELGPGAEAVRTLRLRVPSTATVSWASIDGRAASPEVRDGWLVLQVSGARQVDVGLVAHDWLMVDGEAAVPPFGNTTGRPADLSHSSCSVFHGWLMLAAHSADNSASDLLRAVSLVWPRARTRAGWDGKGVDVDVSGHDTFAGSLRLEPLASEDRQRHDEPVRASFAGLLFERRRVH